MPLTLITGPANAAKAGAVLERLRAALPREPVLVVPTSADAEHYARELAGAGLVFGAEVDDVRRLIREIARGRRRPGAARWAGSPGGGWCARRWPRRRLRGARAVRVGPGLRRRAGRPVRRARPLARRPGAVRLGAATVRALRRASRPTAPGARRGARRAVLRLPPPAGGLGAVDADGLARAALDGLRRSRTAWDGRPLFLYGFDDLHAAAARPGRDARPPRRRQRRAHLRARPGGVRRQRGDGRAAQAAGRREHVAARDRAPSTTRLRARGALHHLERELFEPDAPRRPPNGAVRLLEAGGERAEAELVGASVLELLRDGMAPRTSPCSCAAAPTRRRSRPGARELRRARCPSSAASRSRARGSAPASSRARAPRCRTARPTDLSRGCARPGRLPSPDLADAVDARARRAETKTAAAPAAASPTPPTTLDVAADAALAALDRLADAAAEGAEALLAALVAEADAIWTAPHRRAAAVLDADAEADARAAARAAERGGRAARRSRAPTRGSSATAADVLEALAARRGPRAGGAAAACWSPIRSRSARAASARCSSCGLQEGELPAPPAARAVPRRRRPRRPRARQRARAARHEDVLARER